MPEKLEYLDCCKEPLLETVIRFRWSSHETESIRRDDAGVRKAMYRPAINKRGPLLVREAASSSTQRFTQGRKLLSFCE